jgi:hypothetical protein
VRRSSETDYSSTPYKTGIHYGGTENELLIQEALGTSAKWNSVSTLIFCLAPTPKEPQNGGTYW